MRWGPACWASRLATNAICILATASAPATSLMPNFWRNGGRWPGPITNAVPGWAITNGGNGWTLTGPVSADNTSGYTVPFAGNEAGVISLLTPALLPGERPIPVLHPGVSAAAGYQPARHGEQPRLRRHGGRAAAGFPHGRMRFLLQRRRSQRERCLRHRPVVAGLHVHPGAQWLPGVEFSWRRQRHRLHAHCRQWDVGHSGATRVLWTQNVLAGLPQGSVIPATLTLASNINFTAYGVRRAGGGISALLNNKETNDYVAGEHQSGAECHRRAGDRADRAGAR